MCFDVFPNAKVQPTFLFCFTIIVFKKEEDLKVSFVVVVAFLCGLPLPTRQAKDVRT